MTFRAVQTLDLVAAVPFDYGRSSEVQLIFNQSQMALERKSLAFEIKSEHCVK